MKPLLQKLTIQAQFFISPSTKFYIYKCKFSFCMYVVINKDPHFKLTNVQTFTLRDAKEKMKKKHQHLHSFSHLNAISKKVPNRNLHGFLFDT